jgi:hypothetical protein
MALERRGRMALEALIPESGASAERAPSGPEEEYVRSWGSPPAGVAAADEQARKDYYAHLLEPTFASLSRLLNATTLRAQLAYQPSRQL